MAFSFASFIPPRAALNLVRIQIQNQLNEFYKKYEPHLCPINITEYDAVIDFVADHISFIIPGLPGNPYPFNEAKKYMAAIKEMTSEDLKKECIIDKIIIHYKDKSLTAEVWFRDGEGNKHKQLKKL